MNSYQKEQLDALILVRSFLTGQSEAQIEGIVKQISTYLQFRQSVDQFLEHNFSQICTANCYQNHLSACCSRDGIITFFGDVMVNALVSTCQQLDVMMQAVQLPQFKRKCIYLSAAGCLWQVKPSVCAMFLCENAQLRVFEGRTHLKRTWDKLKLRERTFKWPDRPVLFDQLEEMVIDGGLKSPLMYLHNSPGLIRVKQRAGLL